LSAKRAQNPPGSRPAAERTARGWPTPSRRYTSTDLKPGLEWPNSTLLHGDVPAAVADLKQSSNANLVIMGSGVLIASLMAAEPIDEYLLSIALLVLGTGRRMFPKGVSAHLRLTDSMTTSKGVIIATYEPAGNPRRAT
jgi:dihydrofolate reductase